MRAPGSPPAHPSGVPVLQIDAFAQRPFTGNPAAVCLLDQDADPTWMAAVAAEMNLSETAFVVPRPDGFGLRWFTPSAEVDLCGHATLASAHALWESGRLAPGVPARFHTRSGVLTAQEVAGRIALDLPAIVAAPLREEPRDLHRALGAVPVAVHRARGDLLVELPTGDGVRRLQPDLGAIAALDARGVIVTAADREHDFVSRFFAPRIGIPEDPVTGAAHCALGPYWAARLGRTDMVAYQASTRGGFVHVTVTGDRVVLAGRAVTVMRGVLV